MISYYRHLVADYNRIEAFEKGIRAAVRPGDTVCEIGTGLGTFAFMASRAGAAKVYAIEQGAVVELAKKLYAANQKDLGEIEFIRQNSAYVHLPEKVDVVIYEDFEGQGISPAHEMILADARRRFLKPGGVFVPSGMELNWAPLQAEEIWQQQILRLEASQEKVFGFDYALTRELVVHERIHTVTEADTVLATPIQIERINFAEKQHLEFTRDLKIKIETAGILHGFGSWADFVFAGGHRFSLTYEQPATLFGRAFFALPEPVAVESGDSIQMKVSVVKKPFPHLNTWTWWGQIADQQGRHKYNWQSSTLNVVEFQPQDVHLVRCLNDDYRPVLSQEGHLRKNIMEFMDGSRTIKEIAKGLTVRFPERFQSFDEALAKVARLVKKLSINPDLPPELQ